MSSYGSSFGCFSADYFSISNCFVWSISIISFYRDFYDDIYSRLGLFENIIGNVLQKEIYVSDPVIRDLVDELRSLQFFISQLEEQQTFSSLGEKIDE